MSDSNTQSENYNAAIEAYYQLKQKYEAGYKKKKNKIKRRDISSKEKQQLIRKINLNCIQCRKKGGTLFTNIDSVLKATCGNRAAPCDLHIEVKKSDWRYLPSVITHVDNIVNNIKTNIIKTKLNFLFGLEEENFIVEEFEKLKNNFNDAYSLLVNLEESREISHEWKERAEQIQQYILQLHLQNEEFGSLIQQYKDTGTPSLLQEAIQIYINQILETQKKIHYEKYAHLEIDRVDSGGFIILNKEVPDKYILRAFRNGIKQEEHQWDAGEVISNLK